MRASVSMAGEGFARLRRQIAEIEGRPQGLGSGDLSVGSDGTGDRAGDGTSMRIPAGQPAGRPAPARTLSPRRGGTMLPLGVDDLDRRLGGGLRRDGLHEIRGSVSRDTGAATGFATGLLARLARLDGRPVLWVTEETSVRETGAPYGPGLDRFGLDSRRLVLVVVRRPEDVLWVFEEGLRCTGLAAVLAELGGHPRQLDLTASRRLALRARAHGVTGLLLRSSAEAEPGAALTRWHVAPLPAGTVDGFDRGVGRPAWRLDLERNRGGQTGRFDLEWDHERQLFVRAAPPALSLPGAAAAPDRPDPAAAGIMAFRRAS